MVKKDKYYVWYDLDDAKDMLKWISFQTHDYCRGDAVQDAAEHFYNECDGWEWMRGGCTLYSVKEGETDIYSHEVNVEFEPSFYACDGDRIKE